MKKPAVPPRRGRVVGGRRQRGRGPALSSDAGLGALPDALPDASRQEHRRPEPGSRNPKGSSGTVCVLQAAAVGVPPPSDDAQRAVPDPLNPCLFSVLLSVIAQLVCAVA